MTRRVIKRNREKVPEREREEKGETASKREGKGWESVVTKVFL